MRLRQHRQLQELRGGRPAIIGGPAVTPLLGQMLIGGRMRRISDFRPEDRDLVFQVSIENSSHPKRAFSFRQSTARSVVICLPASNNEGIAVGERNTIFGTGYEPSYNGPVTSMRIAWALGNLCYNWNTEPYIEKLWLVRGVAFTVVSRVYVYVLSDESKSAYASLVKSIGS